MEENKEENSFQEEDFKDFDSDGASRPEIEDENIHDSEFSDEADTPKHEEGLLKEAEIIAKLTQETGFGTHKYLNGNSNEAPEVPQDMENNDLNFSAENLKAVPDEISDTTDTTDKEKTEDKDENAAYKKYIFYISKEFVPFIDSLTANGRTAYINDAIQRKIDSEYEYRTIYKKRRILTHIIIMILTLFIVTPIIFMVVHKSILATFENYRYSQENFEKLYKKRFEKNEAYKRAIEYNKTHNIDK